MTAERDKYIKQLESEVIEKNFQISDLESQKDELIEALKDEEARLKLLASGYEDLEKENKELIEAGKSVKKAYADFTNQVLQADSSQTIQGLQITILASLKSLKKSIK